MRITHPQGQLELSLLDPAVWNDLHAVHAQLHQVDGLARASMPMGMEGWIAARYDDVARVLKDTKVFRNDARSVGQQGIFDGFIWTPKIIRSFSQTMFNADGPDHRRLRRLANKAFTPRRVKEMTDHIRDVAQGLLVDAAAAPEFDLMSAFALPLPLRIISEMLGVEEEDRAEFHALLNTVLDLGVPPWRLLLRVPTFYKLFRFFERLLERKRLHPEDDLTSALVTAEEDGDRLTPEELIGTVFLLLFAGHETTVNLIGNGTLALLDHPEQLARLREDPSLIPSAVEEVVRFHSPANQGAPRYAAEACELGGITLEKGDLVHPFFGAANHDATAFDHPERFDVARSPNEHLGFGAGPHFCIGAHLSRLEGRIAFEALLSTFSELRFAVDREQITWRGSATGLRGVAALPVAVSKA